MRELALAEADKQAATAMQLKRRLAELREVKLQDRSGALALYKELLEQKPDNEDVVARLEQILAKEPQLDEAAAALEIAYRHANNVAKLAQLLDTRAANAVDSYEKKRIYIELATLRAERQNRPELAFMALCRAFREDPTDPQLRRTLERVATAAESEEELVALYEEELPRVRDEQAASDIAFRAGALLEQKLDRPDEALPLFEQSLALDRQDRRAGTARARPRVPRRAAVGQARGSAAPRRPRSSRSRARRPTSCSRWARYSTRSSSVPTPPPRPSSRCSRSTPSRCPRSVAWRSSTTPPSTGIACIA